MKKKFQSIYDIGDKITRNRCLCGKIPKLVKEGRLWFVQCKKCGARSPHSKFAYKAVFQWNMSKHSQKPYFLEIKLFSDCLTLKQAEYILAKEIRKYEKDWKRFMSDPTNRYKRGMKRTFINLTKEQLLYYKWLLEYWKKKRSQ